MVKGQWNHRETGINIKSLIKRLKDEWMLVRQIIKRIIFQIEITSITMAYILEKVCYALKRKDIQMDRAWKPRWKEAKEEACQVGEGQRRKRVESRDAGLNFVSHEMGIHRRVLSSEEIFICKFSKYVLIACYGSDTIQGAGDKAENRTKLQSSWCSHSVGDTD